MDAVDYSVCHAWNGSRHAEEIRQILENPKYWGVSIMQSRTAKILCITLLFICLVTNVYAYTTITIPYDKFNTQTPTYYQTDKTYTLFEAEITIDATYNTSNSNAVIVLMLTNSKDNDKDGIVFKIFASLAQVFIMTDGVYANNKIAEIAGDVGWKNKIGNTWVITYADGKLSIGNSTDKDVLVSNYAYSNFELNYVQVSDGSAVPKSLTSGNVYVSIDDSMLQTETLVYAWIPVIVTFAMLGVVLGLLKKVTK